MEFVKKNIVALVAVVIALAAIVGIGAPVQTTLFGSTSCSSITCLAGGLRLVSDLGGQFESDIASVFSSTVSMTGALTESALATFTGGVKVGTNGTNINAIVTGNCTIWAPDTTIAASTTQQAVCQSATNGSIGALTGVTTDSICNVHIASSTNTTSNGLMIGGVSASSTAGTIVTQISNFTGATFTWSANSSSSPQWTYSCFDPS